jgi:hypothetical protein
LVQNSICGPAPFPDTSCLPFTLINVFVFFAIIPVGYVVLNVFILKGVKIKNAALIGISGVGVSFAVLYFLAFAIKDSPDQGVVLYAVLAYLLSGLAQIAIDKRSNSVVRTPR